MTSIALFPEEASVLGNMTDTGIKQIGIQLHYHCF